MVNLQTNSIPDNSTVHNLIECLVVSNYPNSFFLSSLLNSQQMLSLQSYYQNKKNQQTINYNIAIQEV